MAKRDERRRKTLARMVRLRELETIENARRSAELVANQTRLESLSARSQIVIAEQSARRATASAGDLRYEYHFTQSLGELREYSASKAREMDPQIAAATLAHGQSKHREDRLKVRLKTMTGAAQRGADLRATTQGLGQSHEMARKLNRVPQSGGPST